MRNAWLPVVTVIGLQVGGLLAGAVITETVFSWPGVGRYVVNAIQDRDYLVIQSVDPDLRLHLPHGEPAGRHHVRLPQSHGSGTPDGRPSPHPPGRHCPRPCRPAPAAACGATRCAGCCATRPALVGLAIIAAFVFVAVFAPFIAPYDPLERDPGQVLQPPSADHWMGTDLQGRDVMSRIMYGARISLLVARRVA